MVELSLFLSILAITLPICLTGVFVAKLQITAKQIKFHAKRAGIIGNRGSRWGYT